MEAQKIEQAVEHKNESSSTSAVDTAGAPSIQYCGFKIGDEEYGVPVFQIQEVIRKQVITPIPLAQESVLGLLNLRGQIVTCLSLRNLFGKDSQYPQDFMNIIVKGKDGAISLVVDEVTDILEIQTRELEPTPDTLNTQLKKFVSSVYKLEKGLFIIVDIEKLTQR